MEEIWQEVCIMVQRRGGDGGGKFRSSGGQSCNFFVPPPLLMEIFHRNLTICFIIYNFSTGVENWSFGKSFKTLRTLDPSARGASWGLRPSVNRLKGFYRNVVTHSHRCTHGIRVLNGPLVTNKSCPNFSCFDFLDTEIKLIGSICDLGVILIQKSWLVFLLHGSMCFL